LGCASSENGASLQAKVDQGVGNCHEERELFYRIPGGREKKLWKGNFANKRSTLISISGGRDYGSGPSEKGVVNQT